MLFDILFWIGLFFGGYLLIFFFADIFLDNLKEICLLYEVNPFIIGLLILGIDPEETIASIIAAINGLPYIAMGNVIGNQIISLTLCFALAALFYEIKIKSISNYYFFIIFTCLIVIISSFLLNSGFLIAGIICLVIYIFYLIWSIKHIMKKSELDISFEEELLEIEEEEESSKFKMVIFIIISLLLILVGGELLIYATSELISLTNISESIFGFVIIAFMTNVEELTLIIKSIKKHSAEIGLGGMIGKIIWNLTITFGVSGIITINILFGWNLLWNWVILTVVMVYYYIISWKKVLNWKDAIILLAVFIIFLIINIFFPIPTRPFEI
ncbi:MAG: sodium:calcium antiporter [Candidatus Helarchaeota archaeon]